MPSTPKPQLLQLIRQLGDPVLRQTVRPVAEERFGTPELQTVIDTMSGAMVAANGAGIAANQVGFTERIFIVHSTGKNPRYPYKPAIPLTVFINPELEVVSKEEDEKLNLIEGCLSVPGFRGQVQRHAKVKVTARNFDGSYFQVSALGHAAGTMQHELDHLNGVLFPDHARPGVYGPDALMTWDAYDKFYKSKFEPEAMNIARTFANPFILTQGREEDPSEKQD